MSTQAMPVTNPVDSEESQEKQSASTTAARATKSKKSASAFRTISEVADGLDVQQHVLRFWETKFSQVRPLKRGGGRRYYRPEDVALLKRIHHLLYTEGYTIKGVQKLLREVGKAQILQGVAGQSAVAQPKEPVAAKPQAEKLSAGQKSVLQSVLVELKELRRLVKTEG